MPNQITLNVVRVMNCIINDQPARLEVSFLSPVSKSYIAHKSVMGTNAENTLVLNTSFKILYQSKENVLLCKVAYIREGKKKELIGEAMIDLDQLARSESKVFYLPMSDQSKLLQVRRIDASEDSLNQQNGLSPQVSHRSQEEFLKQRYEFLQRITQNEIEMKKNFSQKVYNLLKDIKYARVSDNTKKEVYDKKATKDNVGDQYVYETPMRQSTERDQQRRIQTRVISPVDDKIVQRNLKQPKPYKLMIDSIQTYGKKDPNQNGKKDQYSKQQDDGQDIYPVAKRTQTYKDTKNLVM